MNLHRRAHPEITRRRVIGAFAVGVAAPLVLPNLTAMAQDETTLRVWDVWTRETDSALIDQLNREFEEAHPGVRIDRVPKSFDDLRATTKLAMSSADGPDVVTVNQGLPDMGAMAAAGILTDLGPYAEQYGWFDKLPASMVARNSFGGDGTVFGEGIFYGMPLTAEFVGVFYNKAKFDGAGIAVPTTMAELEAALATLLEGGEAPIAFGNLEAYPGNHIFGEIQGQRVDTEYLDDLVFGRPDVSFERAENVEAAAKQQEWVRAGYFTPDFSGIGYDDSWLAFKGGEGAMMITGSWISGELATAEDPGFGFFLVPPLEAGDAKPIVAGTSLSYAIRNGSANADLAAEYIDWLVSDRASEGFAEIGVVPLGADPAAAEPGTLYADLVAAWAHILETDSAGHYLEMATPTMFDTMTAAMSELMALAVTPEEFVATLEADHAAYLESKGS